MEFVLEEVWDGNQRKIQGWGMAFCHKPEELARVSVFFLVVREGY